MDCNQHFTGNSYRDHTTCISEAEKYQKSLFRGKKAGQAGSTNKPANTTPKAAPANNGVATNGTTSNGDESKKRKREETDASERAAKKSKVAEESKQEPETSAEVQSVFDLNELKWRRTIKRALKKQGGRMQQSSLESTVIDTLLQDSALRTQLQQLFKQKVSYSLAKHAHCTDTCNSQIRSSKFTVDGEFVALK